MPKPVDPKINDYFERVRELETEGMERIQANGTAQLEANIKQWPKNWGADFVALIWGDFDPLENDLVIESLGISISSEQLERTVIKDARTVHRANIKVQDKSIESIIDASKRINVFLGAFTLVTWTNCSCGWWSFITHGMNSGVKTSLSHENLDRAIEGVTSLKPEIRQKIDSALYWLREPKNSMFGSYRADLIRIYAYYWNAFENLIEAICILEPIKKVPRDIKRQKLDEIFEKYGNSISTAFIDEAYKNVVNPGFKKSAIHALNICFEKSSSHYIEQCFELDDIDNRLYNIRNSINHGSVDAENPEESVRIESRLKELRLMILGMFGRLIPYPLPIPRNQS
jgi:hypothetical protein